MLKIVAGGRTGVDRFGQPQLAEQQPEQKGPKRRSEQCRDQDRAAAAREQDAFVVVSFCCATGR
jgi:hypothetical protein